MALMHVNFFSDTLGMCMNMDVILPQRTKGQIGMAGVRGEGKYPTLYLLHGMSDDHTIWQRRTPIERYVSELGLAVVMPCVHLSFYTDMAHGPKYWTFISEELPRICREFFPNMSDKREDTFAAGLSMGGYGAFKLALGRPDLFSAAASLSGALDVAGSAMRKRAAEENQEGFLENIYGSLETLKGSENDLFALSERLAGKGGELPRLYMWCGQQDFLYEDNQAFRKHLESLNYELTYEESPGGHMWECWDEKIQSVLKWLPIGGKV